MSMYQAIKMIWLKALILRNNSFQEVFHVYLYLPEKLGMAYYPTFNITICTLMKLGQAIFRELITPTFILHEILNPLGKTQYIINSIISSNNNSLCINFQTNKFTKTIDGNLSPNDENFSVALLWISRTRLALII